MGGKLRKERNEIARRRERRRAKTSRPRARRRASWGLSFAASTLVLTPTGERAIASLKTGDTVTAYDPQTGKASSQRVEATSIHHDADLVDVTLQVTTPVS